MIISQPLLASEQAGLSGFGAGGLNHLREDLRSRIMMKRRSPLQGSGVRIELMMDDLLSTPARFGAGRPVRLRSRRAHYLKGRPTIMDNDETLISPSGVGGENRIDDG
jgi:hypothetical protein